MVDNSVTVSNELVPLEPMYLDRHILEHIRTKLRNVKIGTCTKEYGFIKDIELMNVQPAEISMANGGTRFSTTYLIKAILPKPGNIYTSKSVVVINHNGMRGVIAIIDDSCENHPFQIFVMNGSYLNNNYKFSDCDCAIPISGKPTQFTLPNIIVDTVQYHEQQFIVTGKHIHDYCPEKNDKTDCAKISIK